MKRRILLATVLAITGCGPSDDRPAGEGAGADGGRGDDGGGGGSDGDGGETESFPSCWRTCDSPADCSTGTAISDADNFDCESGRCHYRGCNNTEECVASFQSDDYACGEIASLGLPGCFHICDSPSDCAVASAAFDADNYRCTGDGLCEYTGCRDDGECVTSFGGAYGCSQQGDTAFCTLRCETPADCVVANGGPLYDGDNYECRGGFCRFTGCRETEECQASMMSSEYTCDAAD